MESPRLMQQDKVEEQPESGDSRLTEPSQSTEPSEQRLNEDTNSHIVKERNIQEDSEILASKNQDLSETTKSDRKSTDEVEESSSQPVQVEKIEDTSVDVSKNKDQEGSSEQKQEEKNVEVTVEQQEQKEELIENREEGPKETEKENEVDQKKEEDRKEESEVVVEEKKEEIAETEVKAEEPVQEEKKEEPVEVVPDQRDESKTEEIVEKKEDIAIPEQKQEEIVQTEVTQVTEEPKNKEQEVKSEVPVEAKEEAVSNENTQEGQQLGGEMDSSASKSNVKDRSPKVKELRIDIKPTSEKLIILNDSMKAPQSPKTEGATKSDGDSPDVKKYYSNQNLSELIQPESSIELDPKSASAMLKTDEQTGEKKKEENKEAPASASQPTQKQRITMEDFHKITSIGRGSYGEVFLVKKISNNKVYALKAIDKNFMKKENKEYQVFVEKEVLMKLNHPNIIKIFFSFQDKAKLYFVLEYVSGGEFSDYLRIQGKLNKEQIIFFAAEIINILEYIHTFGIAHRDMKPENLLLTAEGHIKCIDFGTARFLTTDKRTADLYKQKKPEEGLGDSSEQKRNHRTTFVGTAQYVSPEMLEGSECGAPADLWALGCMVYLMAVGSFPFMEMNEYLIFQKIKTTNVKYPDDMDLEIKDLIQRLLVKEPEERLGAGKKGSKNDYEALKNHPLFRNVDFEKIHEQKPPVVEIASPHKRKSHGPDQNSFHSNNNQPRKHCHSEDLTQQDAKANNKIFDFQTDKVRVILSGLVLKKCGWLFFKPRQLILNSKPRLVYYDPDSNQLKGEIPLAPTTKAELESKTKFIVKVPNRTFVFKEMEHSAEKWVEIINTAVQQLYSKKNAN